MNDREFLSSMNDRELITSMNGVAWVVRSCCNCQEQPPGLELLVDINLL